MFAAGTSGSAVILPDGHCDIIVRDYASTLDKLRLLSLAPLNSLTALITILAINGLASVRNPSMAHFCGKTRWLKLQTASYENKRPSITFRPSLRFEAER